VLSENRPQRRLRDLRGGDREFSIWTIAAFGSTIRK
jgi:hypothetical protein